jgi:hypothetical protein
VVGPLLQRAAARGAISHGGIEYRHPGAGPQWHEGETWLTAISRWPLHDETDYAAFACLFGVRNHAGFAPLAAARGLPVEVSAGLRAELERPVAVGDMDGASRVNRAELAALDPSVTPERFETVLGSDSHRAHVFAVMRALAGRFGGRDPARARPGDGLFHGLAQVVPQVPPISNLSCCRCAERGALRVAGHSPCRSPRPRGAHRAKRAALRPSAPEARPPAVARARRPAQHRTHAP